MLSSPHQFVTTTQMRVSHDDSEIGGSGAMRVLIGGAS